MLGRYITRTSAAPGKEAFQIIYIANNFGPKKRSIFTEIISSFLILLFIVTHAL